MARMTQLNRRRGTVLVEAAMVLPILLLLTMGLIEYGWLFIKSEQITNAARQGVRCAVCPDATTSEANAAVQAVLNSSGLGGSGCTVQFTPADVAAVARGETVKVVITVPYGNVSLMGGPLVPLPSTLRAEVTMAKEGP